MSVSGSFPKEFYQKFRRESLQEPTEWKDIRKYHLMFGDIRTNTTKKMYILGKGGFVLGEEIRIEMKVCFTCNCHLNIVPLSCMHIYAATFSLQSPLNFLIFLMLLLRL